MSSADSPNLRPPLPWRIAILIAAVACLGLAMCARSDHQRTTPARNVAPAAQNPPTQAPVQQQAAQPPPPSPRKPEYFNATKAPGDIYRR